jgi:hypothetical protein
MTAYMSTEEILDRQQRQAAADAKASSDPASITESDLKDLSPATLSSLMDAGQLTHLGIGARRSPRRRG